MAAHRYKIGDRVSNHGAHGVVTAHDKNGYVHVGFDGHTGTCLVDESHLQPVPPTMETVDVMINGHPFQVPKDACGEYAVTIDCDDYAIDTVLRAPEVQAGGGGAGGLGILTGRSVPAPSGAALDQMLQLYGMIPRGPRDTDEDVRKRIKAVLTQLGTPTAKARAAASRRFGEVMHQAVERELSIRPECPDCKGSGEYVGALVREDCRRCGGSGRA